METVRVSLAGREVGFVRYDPLADEFDPDPGVPMDVASDIAVTFYRENVLFGSNGDGFSWAEAVWRSGCGAQPAEGLTERPRQWIAAATHHEIARRQPPATEQEHS